MSVLSLVPGFYSSGCWKELLLLMPLARTHHSRPSEEISAIQCGNSREGSEGEGGGISLQLFLKEMAFFPGDTKGGGVTFLISLGKLLFFLDWICLFSWQPLLRNPPCLAGQPSSLYIVGEFFRPTPFFYTQTLLILKRESSEVWGSV